MNAAKDSMRRLGRPIDLYQIHFPNAYANEAYWDGLGDAYEQGLVKAVGVSNYGSEAVRACHASLAKRGIPLSSNQIQMSLLYRSPLDNGLKETCDELGVQTIAYSPLALGLLTGKYSSTKVCVCVCACVREGASREATILQEKSILYITDIYGA